MAGKEFKKAVILAAGRGKRLRHETENAPKALLNIGGHSLIELIFRNLSSFTRIDSVIVATGHMADAVRTKIGKRFERMAIEYVESKEYDSTNNAYTLWLLKDYLREGFLLVNTDVLFDGRILAQEGISFDRSFLVIDSSHALDEEDMKVELRESRIVNISKELNPSTSHGEYIGICGFDPATAAELARELDETVIKKKQTGIYYEDVIAPILNRCPIYAVESSPLRWIEIDTLEDLASARNRVYPEISGVLGWK